MKKVIFALVILALLVMPVSATAGKKERGKKERVGQRIVLGYSASSPSLIRMAAGEPFHIVHGCSRMPKNVPPGRFRFELLVDGVPRKHDFVERSADHSGDEDFRVWDWVHNFPDGMSGEVEFTGNMLVPCRWAVEEGYASGPCPRPNSLVAILSRTMTVDFLQ